MAEPTFVYDPAWAAAVEKHLAAQPAPPPPAPAAPTPVNPFPTADDMLAVNDWLTNWQTQMEDIDFSTSQQEIDTSYQKGANERQAAQDRAASDEAMAARGLFQSSLRDAQTYDIEATKALANTYLENKLSETVTAGATRKNTLASSKINFEAGMRARYGDNAKGVNDQLNDAYATALANYKPPTAKTAKATGPTAASKAPAAGPVAAGPQAKANVQSKPARPTWAGNAYGKVPAKRAPKAPAPKKR